MGEKISNMTSALEKSHRYDWSVIDNRVIFHYFQKYNNVFLESLENSNLFDLYKKVCPLTKVCCIEKDMDIKFDESDILIVDSYSKNCEVHNIVTCESLWEELFGETVAFFKPFVKIRNDWVSLEQHDVSFEKVIRYFDDGEQALFVTDYNGEFKYTIFQSRVRRKYQFHMCKEDSIYVDFDESDDAIIRNSICVFLRYPDIKELPILKGNRIIAVVSFMERREQVLQWNLIRKETAMEYFGKGMSIVLSSDSPKMQGFYDYFKDLFSISVLESDNLLHYYSGDFDVMLYMADIWCKALTRGYDIQRVYLDLLAQNVVAWLEENHISYIYLQMAHEDEIVDYLKRWAIGEVVSGSNREICGYYIQNEAQNGEVFNVVAGRRVTYHQPKDYEHTIYVFGPCIAIGSFANDADTIQSYLQKKINECGLKYRVVNCGGGDSPYVVDNDINSLLIMLNTRFLEGDIVVHFGEVTWQNNGRIENRKIFSCAEPFNRVENRKCSCFVDGVVSHLTKEGNQILANYLYEILESRLTNSKKRSKEIVLPYHANYDHFIQNNDLKKYLHDLEKECTLFEKVGCIIMNCNPFTLGHYKLVEQSSRQVDFLYVFVVEEDKSEFKFADRYEMAKRNCKDFCNVKVLPSGNYMISSITFAEYFNKKMLQEQKINPVMDIQLFAYFIAPLLNIRYRFVGEEPFDRVTAQYNKAMREWLPLYGIELIEIPRFKLDDTLISATTVRKYIKTQEWDKVKELLPSKTYEYLVKNSSVLKSVKSEGGKK